MPRLSHSCRRRQPGGKREKRRFGTVATVAALATTLLLLGCSVAETGGDPQTIPPTLPTFLPEIAALVPASIKDDGILDAVTDPNYAPMEFTDEDGVTVVGVDIDLTKGVAEVLGLTPRFKTEAYTAIPAGVRTGQFELGIASFTIRPEDQLRTNAVLYFESGTQLVRSTQVPALTRTSMCGHTIASLEGSVQVETLTQESKDCRRRGYSDIEIVAASTQESVTRAVIGGRADGMLADIPVANLEVEENRATIELAGDPYNKAPLGMLTKAELRGFAKAVRRAVQSLIDSGYYAQVLRTWGVSEGAVGNASIRWSTT